MTFKSILVYRDRRTSAKVQLALAGKLAEVHNAQIVDLAVRQTQIYPMGFVEMIPQDVINFTARKPRRPSTHCVSPSGSPWPRPKSARTANGTMRPAIPHNKLPFTANMAT